VDSRSKHFVLFYEVVDDMVTRRAPHREAHLRLIREAHARGDLVMAGALGDPPDGGLFVFRAEAADVAEAFARADPYVTHGLVTSWKIKPWTVVTGA
jgi:uncharacterized protein